MTRLPVLALLFLSLGMAGCGGGGSSPNSGNTGNPGGGVGSGPPNSDGTAEIIFPWTTSGALTQTVTVSGVARDPDGVAGVSVNGVASSVVANGLNSSNIATGLASSEKTAAGSAQKFKISWLITSLESGQPTTHIKIRKKLACQKSERIFVQFYSSYNKWGLLRIFF